MLREGFLGALLVWFIRSLSKLDSYSVLQFTGLFRLSYLGLNGFARPGLVDLG